MSLELKHSLLVQLLLQFVVAEALSVKMASGVGDGKRKRGYGRNMGSGSGDGPEYPGDPPTDQVSGSRVTEGSAFLGVMAETPFQGVRVRVVVEIRGWAGKGRDGKSRDFNMDVKMLKDVEVVGAIIHDLARSYWSFWNPDQQVKSLNIHRVEDFIRKRVRGEKIYVGKDLLDEYVRDHPLTWVDTVAGSKEFTVLKKDIADRALPFLKVLKDAITKGHSRAGRQRQDEDQIFAAVEGVDPVVEDVQAKEIQRLQNRVASLEKQNAERNATIDALMGMLVAAYPDFNSPVLQDHQSDQITDLEVTYAAKLKAKDDIIASLEQKLQTAQDGYLISKSWPPSPSGFLVSPVATGTLEDDH